MGACVAGEEAVTARDLTEIAFTDWTACGVVVFVGCPGCREAFRLVHEIDDVGNVSPSLDCPRCEFHDFVRLVDWPGR